MILPWMIRDFGLKLNDTLLRTNNVAPNEKAELGPRSSTLGSGVPVSIVFRNVSADIRKSRLVSFGGVESRKKGFPGPTQLRSLMFPSETRRGEPFFFSSQDIFLDMFKDPWLGNAIKGLKKLHPHREHGTSCRHSGSCQGGIPQ